MDLVSLVIPLYNQEEFISDCLDSICEQTYTNIEVIVIDDGSVDNSFKIAKRYEYDHRVKCFHQDNAGVSSARNLGIKKSHGDWICFIDPDDYVSKTLIQTLIDVSKENTDSKIIISSFYAVKGDQIIRQHFFPHNFSASTILEKKPLFLQLFNNDYDQCKPTITGVGVPWGKLYHISLFRDFKILFDQKLPRMQDNLFNMIAFYVAAKITFSDYSGYYYRIDETGSRFASKVAKGLYRPAMAKRLELLTKFDLSVLPEAKDMVFSEIFFFYYSEIIYSPFADIDKTSLRLKYRIISEKCTQLHQLLCDIEPNSFSLPDKCKYFFALHNFSTILLVLSYIHKITKSD
jgi:glycosyltransferase involved in cell wall biosynthesis